MKKSIGNETRFFLLLFGILGVPSICNKHVLTHARTHAHTHERTHARTHTHTNHIHTNKRQRAICKKQTAGVGKIIDDNGSNKKLV